MSDSDPIETDLRDSDPNADAPGGLAGGMGVSSERVGATGPGQEAANGVRDTSADTDPARRTATSPPSSAPVSPSPTPRASSPSAPASEGPTMNEQPETPQGPVDPQARASPDEPAPPDGAHSAPTREAAPRDLAGPSRPARGAGQVR